MTLTLRAAFETLYRPKRLFGKSPETVRLYHHTFDYFDRYLAREATLDDLADEIVMGLMESLVDKGLSVRTANKTRDQISALWNFLARKKIVDQFPDIPALPQPARTPVAWSAKQLAELWEACENQGGWVCGIPAGLYWLALHCVAGDTLERIGAVRQLRRGDLRDDLRWVHFRAETRKGRKRDFTCKLHGTTTALLVKLCGQEPDSTLVFPWDKHPCYFWSVYKTLRLRAGLPTDREHSFHCIRKTGASFAEAAGVDASRLLGHSDRRVTETHYLDPMISGKNQASDVLFRPAG